MIKLLCRMSEMKWIRALRTSAVENSAATTLLPLDDDKASSHTSMKSVAKLTRSPNPSLNVMVSR